MTKLIIFDLDGTLLNTIGDLANAANFALNSYNFPSHSEDAYRFMVGNGINKLLERSLPEANRDADTISMVRNEFLKYYFEHADEQTRPYVGIPELIDQLQADGYLLGVASNKIQEGTTQHVSHFFPHIQFTAVLGQRDNHPVKPHPSILEEIIAKAGVTIAETLYVGDSGVDVTTALNADVPFVGVLWGFRPEEELSAAGATRFVDHPLDILKLL